MSPSTLLLREACYRAVGEGFAHVSQHIDFTAWYASELQGLLEKGYTVSFCPVCLHSVTLLWLLYLCQPPLRFHRLVSQ